MRLPDFVNKHAGKTGVICGKGKSLDVYASAWSDLGEDRPHFCVNESTIPMMHHDPYWMAIDGQVLERMASHMWGGDDVSVLRADRARQWRMLGYEADVEFACTVDPAIVLERDRDVVASCGALAMKHGTAEPLVHFAWLTGVTKLVFVGFDGDGYAECILALGVPESKRDYGFLRDEAFDLCDRLGIQREVWGG